MGSYRIKTYNKISNLGLDIFPKDKYLISEQEGNPEIILLRSYKMNDDKLNNELLMVGRAGVGVNNVPVDRCTKQGVVVFNAPGANANAVKEVVIAGLFLSSRNIYGAITLASTLKDKGDEVPKIIEKEKNQFVGPEIAGKKLGLIGLGAIGGKVANAAIALGMKVYGYDPFLSIEGAIALDPGVKRVESLKELLVDSDYLSLHVPLLDSTKKMFNKKTFEIMKKGVRILNFSRGELVCDDGLEVAINEGRVASYVTDFPNARLLSMKKVIPIPHIGASTPESEENCAVMIANQTRDFMEYGIIRNSVNFPFCTMVKSSACRLTVVSHNSKDLPSELMNLLSQNRIKVIETVTERKDEIASKE